MNDKNTTPTPPTIGPTRHIELRIYEMEGKTTAVLCDWGIHPVNMDWNVANPQHTAVEKDTLKEALAGAMALLEKRLEEKPVCQLT